MEGADGENPGASSSVRHTTRIAVSSRATKPWVRARPSESKRTCPDTT